MDYRAPTMSRITAASVHAFYLFDVAQTIDLARLRAQFGERAGIAQLQDKTPGPPRVRYLQPPVIVDGAALDVPNVGAFRVRVKFYDYGVISVMLSQPFDGTWSDLVRLGQDFIESEPLEAEAAAACKRVVDAVRGALSGVRTSFLSEDYLAFVVSGLDTEINADSGAGASWRRHRAASARRAAAAQRAGARRGAAAPAVVPDR